MTRPAPKPPTHRVLVYSPRWREWRTWFAGGEHAAAERGRVMARALERAAGFAVRVEAIGRAGRAG